MKKLLDGKRRREFLKHFAKLEEDIVLAESERLLAEGLPAEELLNISLNGLKEIGRLYEKGGYFVAGLILASELMRNILDLIARLPGLSPKDRGLARILVGTIEGDIHDLGKNVASMFLRAHGYEVFDLGVEVPPAIFLSKTLELQPNLVGISMLITTSFPALKRAVHMLKNEIPLYYRQPFVAVGGGAVDEQSVKAIGADALTGDFENTLALCGQVCQTLNNGSTITGCKATIT